MHIFERKSITHEISLILPTFIPNGPIVEPTPFYTECLADAYMHQEASLC